MSVDLRAKAEVAEQLAKLRMLLAYETMMEAKALWLERPVARDEFYADYKGARVEWTQAEIEYLVARRELIRWDVVK